MSEGWIQQGNGELWHRISMHRELEFPPARELVCCCGTVIRVPPLTDAVDELVAPDDQHPACRDRMLREHYWRKRIPPGDLRRIVHDLCIEVDPKLVRPAVFIRIDETHGMYLIELRAGNRAPTLGSGQSMAIAVGDLLATLEEKR